MKALIKISSEDVVEIVKQYLEAKGYVVNNVAVGCRVTFTDSVPPTSRAVFESVTAEAEI